MTLCGKGPVELPEAGAEPAWPHLLGLKSLSPSAHTLPPTPPIQTNVPHQLCAGSLMN